jgi:hypothetical protein
MRTIYAVSIEARHEGVLGVLVVNPYDPAAVIEYL